MAGLFTCFVDLTIVHYLAVYFEFRSLAHSKCMLIAHIRTHCNYNRLSSCSVGRSVVSDRYAVNSSSQIFLFFKSVSLSLWMFA